MYPEPRQGPPLVWQVLHHSVWSKLARTIKYTSNACWCTFPQCSVQQFCIQARNTKPGPALGKKKRNTKHFKAAKGWQIQQDGWGDRERQHVEKMGKRKHSRDRKRKCSEREAIMTLLYGFYSIHITLTFRFSGLTMLDIIKSKLSQFNVFDCIFDILWLELPCRSWWTSGFLPVHSLLLLSNRMCFTVCCQHLVNISWISQ